MLRLRMVLTLKDHDGKQIIPEDNEFYGENGLRRALAVADAEIKSWVFRDGREFVSLNITKLED